MRFTIRIWSRIVLFAALSLVVGCGKREANSGQAPNQDGDVKPKYEGPNKSLPVSDKIVWSGSAADLIALSYDNKLDGVKDKWVEVGATLNAVSRNQPRNGREAMRGLSLSTGNVFQQNVMCDIPLQDGPPGKYTIGQTVKVKGILRLPVGSAVIHLEQSAVLKAGPNTAIEMTPDELLQLDSNTGSTQPKRYQDKSVILTGKISTLKPGLTLVARPILASTFEGNPWSVECMLYGDKDKSDKPLGVGQSVKIIGAWSGFDPERKVITIRSCELITE